MIIIYNILDIQVPKYVCKFIVKSFVNCNDCVIINQLMLSLASQLANVF